jgi:hypothetical protein
VRRDLALFVFEEFDLLQSFFAFFFGFVRPAEIFALFGENFVAARDFLDHKLASANSDCENVSQWLDVAANIWTALRGRAARQDRLR